MQSSAEIRWFGKGDAIQKLYDALSVRRISFEKELQRTDWYLQTADHTLGVKLREGNIELKRLITHLGAFKVGNVSGAMEQWQKWSFRVSADDDTFNEIVSTPHPVWIAVSKDRKIAKFEIRDKRNVTQVPLQSRPIQGCNLEIASLVRQDQQWWTVCLEAFGPEANVGRYLQLALDTILTGTDIPTLTIDHSYGYPKWIAFN